jgi:hypothetical protein
MARNSSPSTGVAVSKRPHAIDEALDDVVAKALKRHITPSLGAEGPRVIFAAASSGEEVKGGTALAAPCVSFLSFPL